MVTSKPARLPAPPAGIPWSTLAVRLPFPATLAARRDGDQLGPPHNARRQHVVEHALTACCQHGTPPWSETVDWLALTVAESDIARFAKLYPMNARPIPSRNRRFI